MPYSDNNRHASALRYSTPEHCRTPSDLFFEAKLGFESAVTNRRCLHSSTDPTAHKLPEICKMLSLLALRIPMETLPLFTSHKVWETTVMYAHIPWARPLCLPSLIQTTELSAEIRHTGSLKLHMHLSPYLSMSSLQLNMGGWPVLVSSGLRLQGCKIMFQLRLEPALWDFPHLRGLSLSPNIYTTVLQPCEPQSADGPATGV